MRQNSSTPRFCLGHSGPSATLAKIQVAEALTDSREVARRSFGETNARGETICVPVRSISVHSPRWDQPFATGQT